MSLSDGSPAEESPAEESAPEGRRAPRRGHPRQFEVAGRTVAPTEAVWSLVGVASEWKKWSWITRAVLVSPGRDEPEGVGALRRFGVGRVGSVEEVVAWEPPAHLGYVARRGLPVRRYRADVHLEPHPGGAGTLVRWKGSLEPLVPGTGPAVAVLVRAIVAGFTRRLCRYADRLPSAGAEGPGPHAPGRARARPEEGDVRW